LSDGVTEEERKKKIAKNSIYERTSHDEENLLNEVLLLFNSTKMPAKTPKTVAKKSSHKKKADAKFPKSYKEMIKECLKASEERSGLSAKQLQTYIKDT